MQKLFLNIYCVASKWFDSNRLSWFGSETKDAGQAKHYRNVLMLIKMGKLVPATTSEQKNDAEKGQYHVLMYPCPLFVSDGTAARENETALEKLAREAKEAEEAQKAKTAVAGSLFSLG